MKKYFLYAHDGSGNHGCEALVRSTASLINVDSEHLILISERPEEDLRYGIEKICTVKKRGAVKKVAKVSPSFIKAYFELKFKNNYYPLDFIQEVKASGAHLGDVALSIGGDTYCYGGTERLCKTHLMWRYAGLKTVYWGCSIEPELLSDEAIAKDVSSYDLITARESISYEALKKINPNTLLVSDSAFLLNCQDVSLPDGFNGTDIVGINTSPLIEQSESISGITRKNYEVLIETILEKTNMKILLIPHVIWDALDDRKVLNELYGKYSSCGRIYMVNDCNCEKLKGYISKCRFFIGARTHATIAAYSCCIPTLVVGYSVKSKGIARDLLGTEENYVLSVQNLTSPSELADSFEWLIKNEESIRQRLFDIMPEYKNRVYAGIDALRKL